MQLPNFSRVSREFTMTQSRVPGLWAATEWLWRVFGPWRLKSRLSRVTRPGVDRGWVWITGLETRSGVLKLEWGITSWPPSAGNHLARNICFFNMDKFQDRLLYWTRLYGQRFFGQIKPSSFLPVLERIEFIVIVFVAKPSRSTSSRLNFEV